MPALNFLPRFADAVERGEKRQTIRKRRKDGRDPKPGDKLYLFTGQRTKHCRRLIVQRAVEVIRRAVKGLPLGHVVECTRVEAVEIDSDGDLWRGFVTRPYLRLVHYSELDRFAWCDGLKNWDEMLALFKKMHGLPFEGLLIRW